MATGMLPFQGATTGEMLEAIFTQTPPSVVRLNPKVPVDLERIIYKALEKDPELRYRHASEMRTDLQRIRRDTTSLLSGQPPLRVTARRPKPLLFIAVIVLILMAGFGWWLREKFVVQKVHEKSIAVLPFKNMSQDKSTEYFTDGMTEDIITQLSKIGELKVISRSSVMQYKDSTKGLRAIGEELNVGNILEGSVRKEGNQIRITGQLIDAKTDKHIWAETYDRKLEDVFVVQSDVAEQIAAALKAKLSGKEKQLVAKKPTENLSAYDYYLKGRSYYERFHKQDNDTAIELYQKAIQLDPNFALGYAGLADAYSKAPTYGYPDTTMDKALELASKAIALDPNLAEGYKALGNAYYYKGKLRKALEVQHKAIELNPNYAIVIGNLGNTYAQSGNLEEALRWTKKNVELDPTTAFSYYLLGGVYLSFYDFAKAEQYINKSLELQPDFTFGYQALIDLYIAQGNCPKAIKKSQDMLSIEPESQTNLIYAGNVAFLCGEYEKAKPYFEKSLPSTRALTPLGFILWKEGHKEEATKLFNQAFAIQQNRLKEGNEGPGPRYGLARIYAMQGNKTEAYKWLQAAIDRGWLLYRLAMSDPLMENLRGEARFQQMMAQVKAKVDRMRKHAEKQ